MAADHQPVHILPSTKVIPRRVVKLKLSEHAAIAEDLNQKPVSPQVDPLMCRLEVKMVCACQKGIASSQSIPFSALYSCGGNSWGKRAIQKASNHMALMSVFTLFCLSVFCCVCTSPHLHFCSAVSLMY